MLNSQLFTFVFAFVLFFASVLVMYATAAPGLKRMQDLDKG